MQRSAVSLMAVLLAAGLSVAAAHAHAFLDKADPPVGGGAFRVYALGAEPAVGTDRALAAFDRWFARSALAGAIVVLLSAAAMLVATSGMMAGSIGAAIQPETLATVLSQTEFGHVWCV